MMKKTILLLLVCTMSNGWLLANHWTPVDSQYQNNMTLTGVIRIDGVEQQSTTLEVGVFCGEECRGSILPTYFPPTQRYVVLLTIFGVNGDQLTFKLFDHALNRELDLTSPDAVTFTTNGYGSLSEPYQLDFRGNSVGVTQTCNLVAGWNWVSIYVDMSDGSGIAMLEEALGDNAIQIVTEFESADYFGDGEWVGLEDYELSNGEMILIEALEDCTVTLEGMPADPVTVEITLNPGWNWIGFPFDTEVAIEAAFADFEPEDEDIISDTYGSSDYLGEWVGDIVTLVPGQGYLYYNASNETKILIFQTGRRKAMRPTMAP